MGLLVGLLCAFTWATGSIMLKTLSKKLDPFTLNAPRALAGGLATFLFVLATGRTATYHDVTLEKLFYLLSSIAIGGIAGDSLYILSMARIGVSRAFPISSSYPAFTLVFAMIFLHEHPEWGVVAGLGLITVGILLISNRSSKSSPEANPTPGMASGTALAMAASLCWAVAMILVAPGMEGLDSIGVASFRTPALSLMLWGIVAMRKTFPHLRALSRKEWVIMIVGGMIGWGLGSVLFLWTVTLVGATKAAILTSVSPLFALPMSVVLLGEKINTWVILGTILTVVGIILVG